MHVCVGGTFEHLHKGHEALLKKAFELGDKVTIGLSSEVLTKKLGKKVKGFEERRKNLEKFLEEKGWKERAVVIPLSDAYGPAVYEDCDSIVVSPETLKGAEKINEIRREGKLKVLEIIKIPFVIAEDGIPISSSRVKNGELKREKRLKPLIVKIGSINKTKITAARKVFEKFFSHLEIKFESVEVKTKPQPFNEEIIKGVIHRAKKAVSTADYGVGIESGIKEEDGIFMVDQYCAIIDKTGYTTWGKSPAFECPECILAEIQKKEMKEIIPFKNEEEKEKGAIWYLSKGMITREEIIEEAVMMALLPRLKH